VYSGPPVISSQHGQQGKKENYNAKKIGGERRNMYRHKTSNLNGRNQR